MYVSIIILDSTSLLILSLHPISIFFRSNCCITYLYSSLIFPIHTYFHIGNQNFKKLNEINWYAQLVFIIGYNIMNIIICYYKSSRRRRVLLFTFEALWGNNESSHSSTTEMMWNPVFFFSKCFSTYINIFVYFILFEHN